jgi:hypothetical protein
MVPTWLHTPEVAAKMGASMKIRWESHVHPRKGVKHTDETKAKIKEGRAKNPPKISEEGKARTIAATKARWQSPENRAAWTAMMTKPDSQNAKRVARRAAREAAQPSLPLEKAA